MWIFLPFSVLEMFDIMEVQTFRFHYLPALMVVSNYFISFVYGHVLSSHLLLSFLSGPREHVYTCCKARVLFYFRNFVLIASVWMIQVHIEVFCSLKGPEEWDDIRQRIRRVRTWSHAHSDKFTAWGTLELWWWINC